MSSLFKNLLIALVIAVVLWFGYSYFFGNKNDTSTSGTTTTGITTQASQEAQQFLGKLQQLDTINLDGSVFSDDRFNSLVDFRQELTPEPIGRSNPFAPTK